MLRGRAQLELDLVTEEPATREHRAGAGIESVPPRFVLLAAMSPLKISAKMPYVISGRRTRGVVVVLRFGKKGRDRCRSVDGRY